LRGLGDLRVAQTFRRRLNLAPGKALLIDVPQEALYGRPDLCGFRQPELYEVVETAEKRLVEPLTVVGRGDDQAVAPHPLDEDKEGIQHAAHFTHVTGSIPRVADAVELVEEV